MESLAQLLVHVAHNRTASFYPSKIYRLLAPKMRLFIDLAWIDGEHLSGQHKTL